MGAAGDIGYTTGTYQSTMGGVSEKGKYVTAWKKQADGAWKVTEDIFNADEAPKAPAGTHAMVAANALKWGDAPPGMPAGMRAAVVSGDPSQAQPYVIRAQLPANYRIPPHWHPTTENITVLSGTVALGMGEKFDEAAMQDRGGRRIRVGARGDAALFHVENRRDNSGAWNRTVRHHVFESRGRSEDEEKQLGPLAGRGVGSDRRRRRVLFSQFPCARRQRIARQQVQHGRRQEDEREGQKENLEVQAHVHERRRHTRAPLRG